MGAVLTIQHRRVHVMGLNCSGKSSLLFQMQNPSDKPPNLLPSIGMDVMSFRTRDANIFALDMGGRSGSRSLYRVYLKEFPDVPLVFVVDSADTEMVKESVDELHYWLQQREPEAPKIPVLIFANKQDLPHALSVDAITTAFSETLEKNSYQIERFKIMPSSYNDYCSVYAGFEWLYDKPTESQSFTTQLRQLFLCNMR